MAMTAADEELLERLSTPISQDQPAGAPLRYDVLYDSIQEARRRDDPSLPQGIWESENKQPDWKAVSKLCLQGLEQSKDLQLVAWLTEAWTTLEGLQGVERGLCWTLRLSETFWDHAYPLLEKGDASLRGAPYLWLDTKLPEVLLGLSISSPSKKHLQSFSFNDWLSAQHLEALSHKQSDREAFLKQAVLENGQATLQLVWQSIQATPVTFYTRLETALKDCLELIEKLDLFLKTALTSDQLEEPVSFFNLHKQLIHLSDLCKQWKENAETLYPTQSRDGQSDQSGEPTSSILEIPPTPSDHPNRFTSPQVSTEPSQEELTDVLQKIYRMVQKQDPNGLLALFLEQALVWKNKNLIDLFQDFKDEPQVFQSIIQLLSKYKIKK